MERSTSFLPLKHWFATKKYPRISLFDSAFYAKNYPDLRNLRSKKALLAHYIRHGRDEARFANLQQAKDFFARSGRVLPPKFSAHLYARLNHDLTLLYDEPWQFELHYLRHGCEEGRPFTSPASMSGWQSVFSLYDFLLFSESWRTPESLDRAAALALFEHEGVARLAPIARGWVFDPHFYRLNYNLDPAPPVELYRDWLTRGFERNLAPNEYQAVKSYVGEGVYPEGFDWQRSLKLTESGEKLYPAKIKALTTLFREPLRKDLQGCIDPEAVSGIYKIIGDYHLSRKNMALAAACYELACASSSTATSFVRRGDVLLSLGKDIEAYDSYRKALSFPDAPVWALVHASRMSVDAGETQAAFTILQQGRPTWGGNPAFRKAVDDGIEERFRQIHKATRERLKSGDLVTANANALEELDVLTSTIASNLAEAPVLSRTPTRFVMLACLDLPQCTHYRVEKKVEQLKDLGHSLEVYDFKDPARFKSSLPGAAAAIFYRVPSYPKIVEAILYARQLGIVTFYDIDDLIFTEDFPDTYESYEGQISLEEYNGLQSGVSLFHHAISLCDVGLASTEALGEKLRALVRSKTAYVIANALGANIDDSLLLERRPKFGRDSVNIFYGSGTKAHNKDFSVLVGPAIIAILEKYPHVTLTIVGYLALDASFGIFSKRISQIPFINNRQEYETLLSSCDINISVLASGIVSDCKSEIKWLEAAILRIPTVVSHTATFATVLNPPVDGLIANDTQDWIRHLSFLIEHRETRKAIGAAAYQKAIKHYSSGAIGKTLLKALSTTLGNPQRTPRTSVPILPRVLVCNVFYPPQSVGGATRVVEANVDHFIEHYKSVFEISVLATDYGAAPGYFGVEIYKGVKVFRIGTPAEANMDWRPFNQDNVVPFNRVLDLVRPDLVHFHCIQRLTASIVRETHKRTIPYVVTVHDAWWISDHQFLVDQEDMLVAVDGNLQTTLPVGVTRPLSIERRQRLASLLNNARATLAVSEKFGGIYEQAGITNVRCIANGTGELPARLPSRANPNKLVLGHVGGRSAHKGATLVEVVLRQSTFENLELIMVDSTLDPGNRIKTMWGSTEIAMIGHHPPSRVNELFASFDVLLAPSIWPESFGLVAREALFYGKWVVASDRGAMADEIIEGVNGFKIDVGSTLGLRAILTQMNGSPQTYKKPVSSGVLRSADDQAEDLAKLYMTILDQHSQEPLADGSPAGASHDPALGSLTHPDIGSTHI